VKAANILLDDDFEAVVGDFGLAKLLDHRDSHVTTAVRGTVGHIAPEYLSTGQSSEKTDVFGYGVLLLELITGQRAFEFGRLSNHNDMMLLDWVNCLQLSFCFVFFHPHTQPAVSSFCIYAFSFMFFLALKQSMISTSELTFGKDPMDTHCLSIGQDRLLDDDDDDDLLCHLSLLKNMGGFFFFFFGVCGQVKKLQAEKRLDLLVDIDLKTDYNPLELEEMVQVKTNSHFKNH
jgi:hypothetical protein